MRNYLIIILYKNNNKYYLLIIHESYTNFAQNRTNNHITINQIYLYYIIYRQLMTKSEPIYSFSCADMSSMRLMGRIALLAISGSTVTSGHSYLRQL